MLKYWIIKISEFLRGNSMDTKSILEKSGFKAVIIFIICIIVLVASVVTAYFFQNDFGRISVSNITFQNYNGLTVRAKLLMPSDMTPGQKLPGTVYVHGYQACRETSDPYTIELARRGFVVLSIDAIGRGNSDVDMNMDDPDFDESFGTGSAFEYLKNLSYVDKTRVGLMGHSLGAGMAYEIALNDPTVKALVIAGFGYKVDERGSTSNPKNMLMIFGKWDEFRERFTETKNFEEEWMSTEQTKTYFPVLNPEFETTYGSFENGTARRVIVPEVTHIMETHSDKGISEALVWMQQALKPDSKYWIEPDNQVWHVKEWCSLLAMIACFASLIPLGLILLRTSLFKSIQTGITGDYNYTCTGKPYVKGSIINGLLIWLYVPSIFIIFGIHKYVIPIDGAFPLMVVNVIVFWILLSNTIGFLIFKKWFKKQSADNGLTLKELGISYSDDKFALDRTQILKTSLLAVILFCFVYFAEYILEAFFIIDFRFIFSFANDLTPLRALLFVEYSALLFFGFLFNGFFLHSQMRRPKKETYLKTFFSSSLYNLLLMLGPIVLLLMVQYVPLFIAGIIPLVGPSGIIVMMLINLFHILGVLILILPLSTWFYQLTGKVYLGALLNTLIVAWMFTSSQVIVPLPA
jgi:hypothetical protein